MEMEEGRMSPLEQQIRDLKLKQAKADLLRFLLTAVETTPLNEDQKQVSEEVLGFVKEFFEARIQSIENGKEASSTVTVSEGLFTVEEVETLRILAARAQGRVQNAPQTPAQSGANNGAFASDEEGPVTPPPPKKNPMNDIKGDKIRFALANRHLDQKKVRVTTRQGQVRGTVVGIDAPHIIVKTETGHTVPVDLENLVVE